MENTLNNRILDLSIDTNSFSQLPLLPDSFGFLGGTGPSPFYPLWIVSTSLPRLQPSFVLLPMQDKTEGEFFMQRLRTSSAGSDSPPPWLSRIRASPARHLRNHFFHFWFLVQTLGRGPTVGSPWSSPTPPSLGKGRVAPPPPICTCRHFDSLFERGTGPVPTRWCNETLVQTLLDLHGISYRPHSPKGSGSITTTTNRYVMFKQL